MKRSHRAEMAKQTVQIIEQGYYLSPSGKRVSIADVVKAMLKGTKLYGRDPIPPAPAAPAAGQPATVEVTSESSFVALQRLKKSGAAKVGCLNFASARNPGGGFLNGAEAQEEALARASALYESLLAAREYYEANRNQHSSLYLDLLIASPDVPFFRDDEGTLLDEPVSAIVITAPAPNAGAVQQNEPVQIPEIEPTLRRRAELVLRIAALHGVTHLVLGAWGCGVFRNDPAMVARTFRDLLTFDGPYARHFTHITFAIFDPTQTGENLAAFRREFI